MIYTYGMRLRPFDMGCQPMNGLVNVKDETTYHGRHYWNVLIYMRELTKNEIENYELERID